MNDAVGTPDDVMETFMKPDGTASAQMARSTSDTKIRIRTVLAERERL